MSGSLPLHSSWGVCVDVDPKGTGVTGCVFRVTFWEAGASGKFLGLWRCVPVSHSCGTPWQFLQDGGYQCPNSWARPSGRQGLSDVEQKWGTAGKDGSDAPYRKLLLQCPPALPEVVSEHRARSFLTPPSTSSKAGRIYMWQASFEWRLTHWILSVLPWLKITNQSPNFLLPSRNCYPYFLLPQTRMK